MLSVMFYTELTIHAHNAKVAIKKFSVNLAFYINPELEQLRQLVAGAGARLAELEASFTKEKSRVDVMQTVLFRQLREHYQQRDRLRLIVDYRRKFLDSLVRGGEEEETQFTSPRPSPHPMRRGRTAAAA